MALLEVDGLVKYFGRRLVVNGVSFTVNAGEVVGLLGPNGAGKTTSFRMATGQIPPNGGRVTFNDEDVTPLPMYQRARRGMGYLSQEPSVFRKLSVENNLIAILEALPRSRSLGRRLTRRERLERTDAALTRFKLDHVRTNTAGRCSGGEKRRLEIARCLVCEPLLILLDEPFAAVDPKTTEDIRQNIRDLAKSGIGILITDHNVREVFRSADRVYLISNGEVVTHGTPHELVNDQKAIDAYLGRSFEEDGFTRHFAARSHTLPGGAAPIPPPPPTPAPEVVAPKSAAPPSSKNDSPSRAGTPAIARPPARPEPARTEPTRPNPGTPTVSTVTPAPVVFPPAPPSPFPSVTPPPGSSFSGVVGGMLGMELLRRDVEALTDDTKVKAAMVGIVSKGTAAIPTLLESLERRDPVLRRRVFEVLKFLAKDHAPLDFDPDGPDEVRLRQIAYLRAKLERRK
ncbi:MAG: lptB 2 [Gemmataceae bacterium]|nr:lptB 2 [Gemmataceae bacterium]